MDAEELGKRGKRAEAAIQNYLKLLKESYASFDFQRQYDARSAGGRFQSQTGDYLIFRPHHHAVLEVKTLHHDFRLPKKNFPAEQIAKLRRREMAGSQIFILVFHSTTERWRVPDFKLFRNSPDSPSWDLSPYMEFEFGTAALDFAAPHLFGRTHVVA